jgi:hypothetical protein
MTYRIKQKYANINHTHNDKKEPKEHEGINEKAIKAANFM